MAQDTKKFAVTVRQICVAVVEVEAVDKEEARDIAMRQAVLGLVEFEDAAPDFMIGGAKEKK